jgi:glycosyltransferase involved in cell wall biosynthesis
MAAGCALLVSDIPELTGTARDAAVAVTPGDADAIAAGIRALRDHATRQHAAERARQEVQRFSIEAAAQSYWNLYNEVAGSIPASPGAP